MERGKLTTVAFIRFIFGFIFARYIKFFQIIYIFINIESQLSRDHILPLEGEFAIFNLKK